MSRYVLRAVLLSLCVMASAPAADFTLFPLRLGAESQLLTTAYDCVHLASGQYFETSTELETEGPAALRYTRCYETSATHYLADWKGTNQATSFPIYAGVNPSKQQVLIGEREGAYVLWQTSTGQISPEVFQSGYTNFGGGSPSGQTNLKNHRMKMLSSNTMEVRTGAGAVRTYEYAVSRPEAGTNMWVLKKERMPSGHCRLFEYVTVENQPRLTGIKTTSANGSLIFNYLNVQCDPHGYTVSANNGQSVRYNVGRVDSNREWRGKDALNKRITGWESIPTNHVREIVSSDQPRCSFDVDWRYQFTYKTQNMAWLNVTRKAGPDNRYCNIVYNTGNGTVASLQAPIGADESARTERLFFMVPTGRW